MVLNRTGDGVTINDGEGVCKTRSKLQEERLGVYKVCPR